MALEGSSGRVGAPMLGMAAGAAAATAIGSLARPVGSRRSTATRRVRPAVRRDCSRHRSPPLPTRSVGSRPIQSTSPASWRSRRGRPERRSAHGAAMTATPAWASREAHTASTVPREASGAPRPAAPPCQTWRSASWEMQPPPPGTESASGAPASVRLARAWWGGTRLAASPPSRGARPASRGAARKRPQEQELRRHHLAALGGITAKTLIHATSRSTGRASPSPASARTTRRPARRGSTSPRSPRHPRRRPWPGSPPKSVALAAAASPAHEDRGRVRSPATTVFEGRRTTAPRAIPSAAAASRHRSRLRAAPVPRRPHDAERPARPGSRHGPLGWGYTAIGSS